MKPAVQLRYKVKGALFGARGCSCGCDLCDCDPCGCEKEDPSQGDYPRWRVSGCHITAGSVQDHTISQLPLLSLTQPAREGMYDEWQDVILIDDRVDKDLAYALLEVFEQRMNSHPAELGPCVSHKKAVYAVPMQYGTGKDHARLYVDFVPEQATLLRKGDTLSRLPLRTWQYDGPMNLRGDFDLQETPLA